MIKNKTITAAGKDYQIQTFPGTKGLTILNKLKTIVGPAFALAMGSEDEASEVAANGLALAADSLIAAMDKEGVEALIIEIVKGYVHDANSQPIIFDTEFSGNFGALFVIIKEILTLNYGTIFLEIGDSGSNLKTLMNP